MTTLLSVWGAAFVVSGACWAIGSLLVASKKTLVALLCGWCCFLLICAVAWIAALPAQIMRPFFWTFFLGGGVIAIQGRKWPELLCTLLATGIMAAFLCAPFYLYRDVLAYGAHGTDMWGYVSTAEWLYEHSVRELPEIGRAAMRFNWSWRMLNVADRPLMFEALACLGSSTGLSPVLAYIAWPVALLASLAIGLAWEPGGFGLKRGFLSLLPAALIALHPLIVLPWIAGFAAGTVAGLLAALAFAAVASAEEGRARSEAFALALLACIFCAGLYTGKFLLVGEVLVIIPAASACVAILLRQGWRGLLARRPGLLTGAVALLAIPLAIATVLLARDTYWRSETAEGPVRALAHFLGLFGGSSPYAWLGYREFEPLEENPLRNPLGLAALAMMVVLFGLVSWQRWRAYRDFRVPLVAGLCLGCLVMVSADERVMAKAMPLFGFSLLMVLATISAEPRSRGLRLAAALVCLLPFLRSAREMGRMLHPPYILSTEENLGHFRDPEIWKIMAYLQFREDTDGFDWAKYPQAYRSLTHFLPRDYQRKLAQKYRLPPP